MGASLNLHRLFHTDNGYLRELRVPKVDQAALSAAREAIRSTLRDAFHRWSQFVTKADLLGREEAFRADAPALPAPKFRIQGGFAYHTANDCQQTPPQRIDQDDGMFLPVSFVTNNGGGRPRITSTGYFKLVEEALKPLCAQNGWTLNPEGVKGSCVRVGISERMHIDIPLYAVKDEAFQELAETAARALYKSDRYAADSVSAAADEAELSADIYLMLAESDIVLADRDAGWRVSDPRRLETWFELAVETYGDRVRRLARAFKGLRDANWSSCKLGSICIMAAMVNGVAKVGSFENNRDDLAILAVGREMVNIFGRPVENPAFPGDPEMYLCKDWSREFRAEVQQTFASACDNLERAIFDTLHKGHAIRLARASFGERIPEDESLITLVGAIAAIREVTPTPQPRPMVPRTVSG